jgi:type II secretory pathway pseudopilin PulG
MIAFNTGFFNNYFVILEASMKVSHQLSELNVAQEDSSAWTYVKFVSIALAAILASFAMSTQVSAQSMSKADYSAAKTRISADYRADKLICKQLAGNAKDICIEEGKAKEKISNAELTFSYTGKAADSVKISTVKADTSYDVAKEKCDDLAGIPKTTCITAAKATHTKALADIKMGKQISAAKIDDAQTKLDADYKVATQNCAALADEAKSSCVSAAKMKFGK